MTYPMHILETRENGSITDTLKREAQRAASAAITAALPQVVNFVQQAAEEQARNVVDALSNAIPGKVDMVKIGKQIAATIEKAINDNLLPELYNRSTNPSKLNGLVSNTELQRLYNRGMQKVPNTITFNLKIDYIGLNKPVTIDVKRLVQAALPFSKFKEIAGKFDPLATTLKSQILPTVEDKAKDLATLAIFSGFLAGCVFAFGMTKIYYSFDD